MTPHQSLPLPPLDERHHGPYVDSKVDALLGSPLDHSSALPSVHAPMSTSEGLAILGSVASAALSPTSALVMAHGAFLEDLQRIQESLLEATREGVAPGTLAAEHLAQCGGKRVRALCVLLSASCLDVVSAETRSLAVVAEMVHASTLLHDDVIDDSDERRGKDTARRIFGNAVSILAGDLLLTHALDRTLRDSPASLPDLLRTLRSLVDGEILQLRGRTQLDLSEATYERIVQNKTASLFGWAARSGARSVGADSSMIEHLGRFGELLGIAFQLVDDVLDYEGDPSVTGKSVLGDLSEGKATLPLLLALRQDPSLQEELLLVRQQDLAAAERVALRVRASGACEETRGRASSLISEARRQLQSLPATRARALLEQVAIELTARHS